MKRMGLSLLVAVAAMVLSPAMAQDKDAKKAEPKAKAEGKADAKPAAKAAAKPAAKPAAKAAAKPAAKKAVKKAKVRCYRVKKRARRARATSSCCALPTIRFWSCDTGKWEVVKPAGYRSVFDPITGCNVRVPVYTATAKKAVAAYFAAKRAAIKRCEDAFAARAEFKRECVLPAVKVGKDCGPAGSVPAAKCVDDSCAAAKCGTTAAAPK